VARNVPGPQPGGLLRTAPVARPVSLCGRNLATASLPPGAMAAKVVEAFASHKVLVRAAVYVTWRGLQVFNRSHEIASAGLGC
jgi:hypothetical protein